MIECKLGIGGGILLPSLSQIPSPPLRHLLLPVQLRFHELWPNFSPVPSAVSDRNRCSPTRVISAKVETIGSYVGALLPPPPTLNGYRAEDGWFILDTDTRCEAVIGARIGRDR